MGLRWLITGGCGFIGSSLIARVRERGDAVRVIDNLSTGTRDDLGEVSDFVEPARPDVLAEGVCELVTADIRDAGAALEWVTPDIDVIAHLAANTGVGPSVESPRLDCEVNVMGTLNYLEAARAARVRRFVFASSGAPVGETEPPIHEEKAARPVSPYGASKLAGEGYCSAYARSYAVGTVALRFGNVYGPRSGHKQSVVAKFIRQAMQGELLEIYGDGGQTRDFIYIDDLVEAILLAANNNELAGDLFQIATSAETSVGELVERLLPVLEAAGIARPEVRNAAARTGDVRRNFSDTTRARERLGWTVQTGLDEGLKRTVEWFTAADRG